MPSNSTNVVLPSQFREVADPGDTISPMPRLTKPVYGGDEYTPRQSSADAQDVAYTVFAQGGENLPNAFGLSALWVYWGQFLDHDIDLTPEQHGPDAEYMKDDPPFSIVRSDYAKDTGHDGIPREQLNVITPLIDASNVYGSDTERLEALRAPGGRLKSQSGPDGVGLLPDAEDVYGSDTGEEGFVAGDVRAQENSGLSSLQSLFVNEHNYWADRFKAEHDEWDDEAIFQNARVMVETLIQKITYEEFLPILVGTELPAYTGYKADADPQITNEFATAAFRFGHTSIPDAFTFLNENGTTAGPDRELFDAFFNPSILQNEYGISPLLRGLLEEESQAIDTKVVDSLNYFLFTPDGGRTGFSLPERNIERGRDHGIDTYIKVRAAVVGDIDANDHEGSKDFSIITSDKEVQKALASVYQTVDEVDLWVGGLAEDYAPGVTIGHTFQAIIVDQFTRLRDADELFYLNRDWTDPKLFNEIVSTRLSDVLHRSGGLDYVQSNALMASNRIGGGEGKDNLTGTKESDLVIGFGGKDNLRGGAGNDDLFGGRGDDKVGGGNHDDHVYGEGGDDTVNGGKGDDVVRGNAGNDKVNGGSGGDDVGGGSGNDVVKGGNGDDVVRGGSGNDTVVGGRGSDRLVGGKGSDRITGNQGNDRFVFRESDTGTGPEKDIITDFNVRHDLIVLKYDAKLAYIGGRNFTGGSDGTELRLKGNTLQGDADGDGYADFEIVLRGFKRKDADALEGRLVQGNSVTDADLQALQDEEDVGYGVFPDL